ncbi:MAG: hypothetical protein EBT03_09190 [Betaproteobacteria bacterium]|nr:hypothetical protein [Betaproteobacteria bacterium]
MQILNGGGCAACYSSSAERYVDFDAAFDGPVLDNGMQIDDLILCENCVRAAAQVLELNTHKEAVETALREAEEARKKSEEWQAYAKRLENVRDLRPVEDLPVVKKTGKKAA